MTFFPKPTIGASILMGYCPCCRVWDDWQTVNHQPCESMICGFCGQTGLVAPTRFSKSAAAHERRRAVALTEALA